MALGTQIIKSKKLICLKKLIATTLLPMSNKLLLHQETTETSCYLNKTSTDKPLTNNLSQTSLRGLLLSFLNKCHQNRKDDKLINNNEHLLPMKMSKNYEIPNENEEGKYDRSEIDSTGGK